MFKEVAKMPKAASRITKSSAIREDVK